MGHAARLNTTIRGGKAPKLTPFRTLRAFEGARQWEKFTQRLKSERGAPIVAPLRKGKRKPASNDLAILRGDGMPTRDELLEDISTEVKKVLPENDDLTAESLSDAETVIEKVISDAEDNLDEEENEEEVVGTKNEEPTS